MRIFLRFVSIQLGLYVIMTLAWVVRFAFSGEVTALRRLGVVFEVEAIGGWLIVLIAGPVSSVQLWRFRRSGLILTAILCALLLIFYMLGVFIELFFLHKPGPLRLFLGVVIVSGVVLALLLSPAARRVCA